MDSNCVASRQDEQGVTESNHNRTCYRLKDLTQLHARSRARLLQRERRESRSRKERMRDNNTCILFLTSRLRACDDDDEYRRIGIADELCVRKKTILRDGSHDLDAAHWFF